MKHVIVIDRWRHPWQNKLVIQKVPGQAVLWMICFCAGALWVHGATPTRTNEAKSQVWWSLKPVVRPALPEGPEPNPIDHFLNAEHRKCPPPAIARARSHVPAISLPSAS